MTKEELLFKVANGMLSGLRTNEILDILKNHSLYQAEAYYNELDEEGRKALEERIIAADAEIAANAAAAEEKLKEESSSTVEEVEAVGENLLKIARGPRVSSFYFWLLSGSWAPKPFRTSSLLLIGHGAKT